MNINLESAEQHAVQAYSDNKIQINSIVYERSLIISKTAIISDLAIKTIEEIDAHYMNLLTQFKPEIIIIGHEHTGKLLPLSILNQLTEQQIGIECMSVGAACRTYNVLLSEHRAVVAGFIFE
ncbi:MTH938/NDUFAF3 family protein [Legionella sp. PATHC035]|uniref:Mth938-like domain-containing protein n=1 Tax=Legionella sp. PATHC035 TaxID=2992040 RepID=UPI002244E690|nr:MTH938/NDUFAF3 family protein [Legionella sp. PATHC035]MCW8407588.1 MTH938/NDUFAF3 family protein [Legionella sp. PATHC035]